MQGNGRTVRWTAFNKPWLITQGNNSVQLRYGPSHQRYQRIDNSNGQVTRYTYVGNYEQIVHANNQQEEKYHIGGFAVVSVQNGDFNKRDVAYLLKDHLGSVVGKVKNPQKPTREISHLAYDPWGKPRHFLNLQALDHNSSSWRLLLKTTHRGFGGHEMLDPVGLIHMGGRVYDPQLGRFLSADPFIQAAGNAQNYNRYSYVMNNPVSYTDPSGFFFKRLKRGIKSLAGALRKPWRKLWHAMAKPHYEFYKLNKRLLKSAGRFLVKNPVLANIASVAACVPPHGPATCIPANAYIAAAQGYAVTNSLTKAFIAGTKSAALAYVQSNVYEGIGTEFAKSPTKLIASHMMAGGLFSVARGGDFVTGAIAAGFAKAGAVFCGGYNCVSDDSPMIRTGVAGLVGGTTSVLTGGKFANGAITAAMAHALNHETTSAQEEKAYSEDDPFAHPKNEDAFTLATKPRGAPMCNPAGEMAMSAGCLAGAVPGNAKAFNSRRAAFRAAKRDAGIPTSQTHDTHTTGLKADRLDMRRTATEYDFGGGQKVQNHPSGHRFSDGSVYDKRHFNNHGKGGTGGHYEY